VVGTFGQTALYHPAFAPAQHWRLVTLLRPLLERFRRTVLMLMATMPDGVLPPPSRLFCNTTLGSRLFHSPDEVSAGSAFERSDSTVLVAGAHTTNEAKPRKEATTVKTKLDKIARY